VEAEQGKNRGAAFSVVNSQKNHFFLILSIEDKKQFDRRPCSEVGYSGDIIRVWPQKRYILTFLGGLCIYKTPNSDADPKADLEPHPFANQ